MAIPTYDILLDDDGDLPVNPVHVTGIRHTMQRVSIGLQTYLGEYILDTTIGIDYIGFTAIKPAPVDEITAILRRVAQNTKGVTRVTKWVSTYDKVAQRITIEGAIETDEGEVSLSVTGSRTVLGNSYGPWLIAYTLPLA